MGSISRGVAIGTTAALGLFAGGCGGQVVFEQEEGVDERPPVSGSGGRAVGGGGRGVDDPCPPTLPETGVECESYDLDCVYPVSCGEALAHCGGFTWQVSLPICQTPFCLDVLTQAQCMQTAGCEWLVPGCGEPALPVAGCQSTADCTEQACPFDWSCELVVVDPCTVDPCGTCFAERLACVPPIDG